MELSEEVIYVLDNYVPVEQRESMEKYFSFQEKMNIEYIQDDYIQLVQEEDKMDREVFMDQIFGIARDTCNDILKEHGIEFNKDSAELSFLIEMVDAMNNLGNYEDSITVMRVLESHYLPEEKFSEILALVSPYTVEAILSRLESVDPAIFKAISSIYSTEEDYIESEDEVDDFSGPAIERVKQYKTMFGDEKPLFMYDYIDTGIVLGMASTYYLDRVFANHIATIDDIETVAQNLIILYSISKDAFNKIPMVHKEVIGNYLSNLNTITKLDTAITKWVSRFAQYYPNR